MLRVALSRNKFCPNRHFAIREARSLLPEVLIEDVAYFVPRPVVFPRLHSIGYLQVILGSFSKIAASFLH
jgi:hypothetical protein